jgi:hypothetical protein
MNGDDICQNHPCKNVIEYDRFRISEQNQGKIFHEQYDK